jgi:hypothetical protein
LNYKAIDRGCKLGFLNSRGWVVLILASILVSAPLPRLNSSLYAQSSSDKKSSKKKKKSPGKSKSRDSSSEGAGSDSASLAGEQRSQKGKYILGNAGLAPQPLIGIGGTFGLVRPNGSILEATATMASGKKGFIATRIIHLGARYRLPLFKIGYYAGGVGFRMASGAWNVLSTSASEYPTSSSLNAVTLDGAVGAQTKFGSIIVSADALGISFPLFKLGVKKSALQETDVDLDDEKKQQDSFDALAAGMNLTIAKVGVGINF